MNQSSARRAFYLLALVAAVSAAPVKMTGSDSEHYHQEEQDEEERDMPILGGVYEVEGFENDAEIEQLARFAVDEHNKKQNALLEFCRLLKVKEQIVSGKMHYLTVEVMEGGEKKLYEAKVWVQLWLDFKQLQEFKYLGPASAGIPLSDAAGCNRGCRRSC